MEITFILSGLLFGALTTHRLWDYAITVSVLHIALSCLGKTPLHWLEIFMNEIVVLQNKCISLFKVKRRCAEYSLYLWDSLILVLSNHKYMHNVKVKQTLQKLMSEYFLVCSWNLIHCHCQILIVGIIVHVLCRSSRCHFLNFFVLTTILITHLL